MSEAERNADDIVFGWGNKFPFSPLASLEVALGLRWNILPGSYSETAYSKTGALVFSTALSGQAEHFSYRLSGALSYSNPDTTGIMRLAGMEGNGLTVEPSEDLGAPCAAPLAAEIPGLAKRGLLYYKDYRNYDGLGGAQLMPYTWTPPADQIYSYTNGSKAGPYLVAGDSQSANGQSLVLDFELMGLNDWVGIQLPVAYQNGTPDLSGIRAILASLSAVDVSTGGSFDVYIQLGCTSEDTEGSGVLEAETSALQGGYHFHDMDNGVTLIVGGGPKNQGDGVIHTEDIDGNGALDAEDASLVFTSAATNFTGDTGWTTYPLPVLDQNALKKARALRIIIVNRNSGTTTGRLLVDSLTLAGCEFWSNVDAGSYAALTVDEVTEAQAGVPLLADSYSEVRDTFHNTGGINQVLQVNWSGGSTAPAPGWTVKTSLGSGVENIRYQHLAFYAYRNASATGDLSFTLLDVNGKGVRCSLPADLPADLPAGAWQKIVLDLFNGTLSINGANVTPKSVTIDGDCGSLVFWSLSLANSSAVGTILCDEVHLRDPQSNIGAAAAFTGKVDFAGPLVSVGGVPLLSDFSLTEQAQAQTAGFSTMYSQPQNQSSFRSLSNLKAVILGAGLEVEVLADSLGDQFTISGGHLLTLPKFDFPVVVTDRYSEKTAADGEEFSHEDTLRLDVPSVLVLGLDVSAYSQEATLNQTWTGNLTFNALAPYNLALAAQWTQSALDFVRAQTWYLSDWIDAFAYTLPWEGGLADSRSYQGSLAQTLNTKPLGVKLAFSSGFNSYNVATDSHEQTDTMALTLSFPFALDSLTFEPYYSRTLSTLDLVPDEGSLEEDTTWHFSRYAAYSYFFTMPPLYEIFSPTGNADFLSQYFGLENADYKPEIGLSLSRKFGSALLDLFLPSKIVFSYGKEYVLQGTLFECFRAAVRQRPLERRQPVRRYGVVPAHIALRRRQLRHHLQGRHHLQPGS